MKILLTFDVEEFDLPNEFGINLNKEQQFEISKKGLEKLLILLNKYKLKATFFTTANFAKKYPSLIKNLFERGHEIASHGYFHCDDYSCNLEKVQKSKEIIEKIINSKIFGFRAPRFSIKDFSKLKSLGFSYDSSLHPTWIPKRYCNLFKKRIIHKRQGILEIPLSTLPFFRAPIFWLAFKNFPNFYPKIFTKINACFSDYTMLVFHPWEFEDLSKIKIPNYIKKKNGQELLDFLEKYIIFCKKKNYEFKTIKEFLKT